MAIINSVKDFKMEVNDYLVHKAISLEPNLIKTYIKPIQLISIEKNKNDFEITEIKSINELSNISLKKGDSICIDFGDHQVGYVSFNIKPVGSPPDAPAHLRIKFGETLCEIAEESLSYNCSISSSWIQEEFIHVDILPNTVNMPRRYAFRYMEIKVLDTSPKYQIVIEDVSCTAVSSADISVITPLTGLEQDLIEMDKIAIKTLHDCMQSVFEDGPKRDRRLWIGDLRLQALTNYVTFKNYDLVKRCLYLFGGLAQNEGRVGACVFIEPKLLVDDTALYDYSLFFISCLYDYYQETKDIDVLNDLWEVAYHQVELALKRVDDNGCVRDSNDWWCFLDWHDELNKQAGAQAILIYTLKQALKLATVLSDTTREKILKKAINETTIGAINYLWDKDQGFFVSGDQKQVSWISQIWFVLAEVFDSEMNGKILDNLIAVSPKVNLITPYAYHHLIEALILNGRKNKALECMRNYWGEMVRDGVDCFWELYDPKDKYASPYGSRIINSYCHAWSCTPSYFLRKYFS